MRRQHTRNLLGVCLCLCLGGAGVATAAPPPSALDPGFGGGGVVTTDFTGGEDGATAVAATPGGDVVATGFGDLGDPGRPHVAGFAVAEYLPDGTPDSSFSGDGEALVDFGFVNQAASSIAIDSEGRIVLTGTITTFDGSTSSIGVARLLPDGTPDPDFGVDGEVVVHPGILSSAYDVAVDGSDRVVVVGAATGSKGFRPMVLRFTSQGEPDGSFGADGISAFGRVAKDLYTSIAVDGHGRLLLAGSSRPSGAARGAPAVRRMSATGSLDDRFGKDGVAYPLGRKDGEAADLTLDPSGRPAIAATCACGPEGDDDFAIGRLTARGKPDASFGRRGRAYVSFGRRDARPTSIAVDPAGRMIAAGSVRVASRTDWAVARLKANGRPDPGFGNGGTVAAPLGAGVEGVQGIAADAESRILAVGLGTGALGSDFAVARFR